MNRSHRTAPCRPKSDRTATRFVRSGLASSCVLAAALLCPSAASAEGLSIPNVGHGMSNPLVIDGTAAFWNPGMVGFIPQTQLTLGGSLILGDVRYTRERRGIYQRSDSFDFALPIEPDAIDPSLTGYDEQVVANPIGLAPGAFALFPLGESGVVMGFGVYAPYAATSRSLPASRRGCAAMGAARRDDPHDVHQPNCRISRLGHVLDWRWCCVRGRTC